MITILEKLLDLIREWIGYLLPWYVLGDDELGLTRRLGVYRRDLEHGWNWKAPVLDEAKTCSGAVESTRLQNQTITTKDGHTVTVSGVLGYRVIDARKYILECGDVTGVLNDIGASVIGAVIPTVSLADVMLPDDAAASAANLCLKKMRVKAKAWGIEVISFGFADRFVSSQIRLMGLEVERADSATRVDQ